MSDSVENTRGLFVVGTDTGVGKTFLTARIARQLVEQKVSVGIYKPVCSGCEITDADVPRWPDVETHFAALDGRFPRERICPQRFRAALAPPVAARLEDRGVEEATILAGANWWQGRVKMLLIEGVGGLLCPVSERWTVGDLAERWQCPLLVVGRLGLGTINHVLLTVEAARRRGLSIGGLVLNETHPNEGGLAGETNAAEIARRCDVPILCVIKHQSAAALHPLSETSTINWMNLARTGAYQTPINTPISDKN